MPLGPFVGDVPDRDAAWLTANGTHTPVQAGQVLLREGEPAEAIFVVLEGACSVTSAELDGEDLPTLGVGEIAGGLAYVRRMPPRVTVLAAAPGAVLWVPFERLDERARTDPGFARRLRERARDAEDLVRQDAQPGARTKKGRKPRSPAPREKMENLQLSELIKRLLDGDLG
ncbi:MAG TPA: Crp/Fnr family transcriptional regulator [Longimicrobiaceae bacterium]|nr:Crp/Fnr family transcriptional regulator [Longimicrobiaceae bacterium]